MSRPAATATSSAFRQTCTVSVDIDAAPERVWALLTDAPGIARWNSTVTAIEGTVGPGARLAISVPDNKRVFKVKVADLQPPSSMVWSSGAKPFFSGVRTYRLERIAGGTRLTMSEELTGLTLPMARKSLPDFRPIFETYAADLKREAEHTPATETTEARA